MKEELLFFLPRSIDVVDDFLNIATSTGCVFEEDYTITPLDHCVRVDVATKDKYNVLRHAVGLLLTRN